MAVTALVASAGTVGAERLITGADIEDGSITARDVKRGSLGRTRLEASARHRVLAAKQRRARQGPIVLNGGDVQVATVTVPAGDHAVQSAFIVESTTTGGLVMCWLGDSAGRLGNAQGSTTTAQQWTTYEQKPPAPRTCRPPR